MSELLLELAMATPSCPLPKGIFPVRSVPMKLPLRRFPVEAPLIKTPSARLPDIRLPSGGVWKTALTGFLLPVGLLIPVACPDFRRRFRREVSALMRVRGAGTIRMIEADTDQLD